MEPDAKRTFYLGRYNCIEHLGSGPLGETYRAKIYGVAGFEKQFAVKRLHSHLSEDEGFVARFVAAASAFAGLEHERIARVHEVNAQGAQYYLVVDLIHGLDLRRLLDLLAQRGETLSPDVAALIAFDIVDTLVHAHARAHLVQGGVLHLGLAPGAVMLTYDGDVRLVDFGLLRSLVRPGWSDEDSLAGTFAYLAPEELRAEPLDARADLFSLGVLLWEMLSGARPFLSDRAGELIAAMESGPPPVPLLDPRLQQILRRALQPDRQQRYAAAEDLKVALQAVLEPRAARARGDLATLVRRLALPRERRTGAFAATTLATASPVGASTPLFPRAVPPPPPPDARARVWAPPSPKPPVAPVLTPIPIQDTLTGLGPDDGTLAASELIELPADDDKESAPPPLPPLEPARDPHVATPDPNGFALALAQASEGGAASTVPLDAQPSPAAPTVMAIEAVPDDEIEAAPEAATETVPADDVVAPAHAVVVAPQEDAGVATTQVPSSPTAQPLEPLAPRSEPPLTRRRAIGRSAAFASSLALAIALVGGGVAYVVFRSQPASEAPARGVAQASVAAAVVPTAQKEPAAAPAAGTTGTTPSAAVATAPTLAKTTTSSKVTTSSSAPASTDTTAGTLEVLTTPAGATVYLDGEARGQTPLRTPTSAGKHTLVLVAEHHRLLKRELHVAAVGERLEATLEAARLPAEVAGPAGLKMRCRTQGELRIFVDGADSGLSCPNDERISVVPGEHKISLYSPRTGERYELEHEVEDDANHSTRVYVKY